MSLADFDLLAQKYSIGQVVYVSREPVLNKHGEVCVPKLDRLPATVLAVHPDNPDVYFVRFDKEVKLTNQNGYPIQTEVITKPDIVDYEFFLEET